MFVIRAYAEATGGTDGYTRAQARQLANETGVSMRRAMATVRANANGNAPFAGRGRRSTPASVRQRTYQALGR